MQEEQHEAQVATTRYLMSHGVRFPDDPKYLGARHRRLLKRGTYEAKERAAVQKAIGPNDTVLELGGGLGFLSTVIAKYCRPLGLHVVEANPTLIPYIKAVHAANGVSDAQVINAVLAPAAGPDRAFHIRGDFLASSLADDLGDAHGGVVSVAKVPQIGLRSTLDETGATFMVCDIEGAEVELLAEADLSGLRAAIIELHPQLAGQAGVQTVFDAMARNGLTYFSRNSAGKVVMFKRAW